LAATHWNGFYSPWSATSSCLRFIATKSPFLLSLTLNRARILIEALDVGRVVVLGARLDG